MNAVDGLAPPLRCISATRRFCGEGVEIDCLLHDRLIVHVDNAIKHQKSSAVVGAVLVIGCKAHYLLTIMLAA